MTTPRLPRSRYPLAVVLLLLAVGAAVVLRIAHPGRTPAPPPLVTPPPQPAQNVAYVVVDQICQTGTDRRSTLDLAFTLKNLSTSPVHVVDVVPLLPLGGLVPITTTIGTGTCQKWSGSPDVTLPPDGAMHVAFHLALPADCPQPLPVQAEVRIDAGGQILTQHLGVFSDLGGVDFDTCPTPG